MTTHARTLDPATSHEAARRAEASGLVETDTALFGRLVREHPGVTIPEMAASMASDPMAIRYWQVRLNRRSGDARRAGLAHSKGERDGATCWWQGREELGQQNLFEKGEAAWKTD
jgi:hypothetical protein